MDDDIYEISSELYEECDYTCKTPPSVQRNNVVSRFYFTVPASLDNDGDLIVQRHKNYLEIEHSHSTNLNLVGLQIWRGSLLLADYLMHFAPKLDGTILELAGGVGLTSIVASMFRPVICTDINRGDIFKLIKSNVDKNPSKHPIDILELDFFAQTLPGAIINQLANIQTIIAADVVYDDRITEAFVATIKRLLVVVKPPSHQQQQRRRVVLLVALEKRYVFTVRDLDTCAPCYEYFLDQLKTVDNVTVEEVNIDFPQYFQYERCKELVLWKISSK